jgi:hypothetical protein
MREIHLSRFGFAEPGLEKQGLGSRVEDSNALVSRWFTDVAFAAPPQSALAWS